MATPSNTPSAPRILVPVDGSEPAERSLAFALGLAQGRDYALDIICVLDVLHVDPFEGYGMTDERFAELQLKVKEDILMHALKSIPGDGPQATVRLLVGPALRTLLKESEADGVEMVVLGRTGKGVFKRLVQGSVANGLAAHSPVPVVIVP